ncbi:hypothetical protein [uncultured Sunxiuqinia sp.]|uniref:hypothetical protein n=1 Tax=uncultured Sunxiuqinia sp. TaxID=1573825 RepID=UPI00261ECB57|nr:hypothetical protein [uncultured Sunxiuqinia sp.]
MKLYRGLNLDKTEIEFIRKNGDLNMDIGAWLLKPKIDHHDLTTEAIIEKVLNEPDNIERYNRDSKDITNIGKYVTGCVLGASIYSHDNNKKEENVIIEIEVEPPQVFIDGRDFLYNSFPRLIQANQIEPNLKNMLGNAFGCKFIQYLEKAKQLKGKESNKIFRLVDYICMDNTIIKSHFLNQKVLIQGRYSTRFLSAFAIIGGIKPEMIIDIRKSDSINRQIPIQYLQSKYSIEHSMNIYDIK